MKITFKSKLPIALWRPPHTTTLTSYSSMNLSSNADTTLNKASLTSRTNILLASIAEEDPETMSTPELCSRKPDNTFKSSSSTCLQKSSLPITTRPKFVQSRSTGNLAQTETKSGSETIKKPIKHPVIKTPFIFPYPIKKKAVVGGNSPAFKMPYKLASKSMVSLTKGSTKKDSPLTTKPPIAKIDSPQIPVIGKKDMAVQTLMVGNKPINRAPVTRQRYVASQRAVVYQRPKEPEDAESPRFDFTALLLGCGTIPNDDSITIELAELYAQLQVNLREYSIIIQQLHECYMKDIETKTMFLEISPRPDKKLLVVDLDHTLCDIGGEFPSQENTARPFLLEFFKAVSQYYEIVIWSEKTLPAIQLTLTALGLNDNPNFKIMLILDNDDMITVAIPHVGLRKIKPLRMIWNKLEQFSKINTIMLDDLPINFYLNPCNGLQIKAYNKEDFLDDDELKKIAIYLNAIAKFCPDFSTLSHKHYGKYRNI